MVEQKGALPPKLLSPYMQNLYRGLFLLGIVGVIVGSCGLIVLLDAEEQKHWYSHTEFGKNWRWLTEKNAMLTNICVNGGALAMITSFLRLQSHKRAEVLESSKNETKKTK